jgi:hypothetical protein
MARGEELRHDARFLHTFVATDDQKITLSVDEVSEAFDLEEFAEKKSGCASLAKDFFRSSASEQ